MISIEVKISMNLLLSAYCQTYKGGVRSAFKNLTSINCLKRLGVDMKNYVETVEIRTETPFDGEF